MTNRIPNEPCKAIFIILAKARIHPPLLGSFYRKQDINGANRRLFTVPWQCAVGVTKIGRQRVQVKIRLRTTHLTDARHLHAEPQSGKCGIKWYSYRTMIATHHPLCRTQTHHTNSSCSSPSQSVQCSDQHFVLPCFQAVYGVPGYHFAEAHNRRHFGKMYRSGPAMLGHRRPDDNHQSLVVPELGV